MRKLLIAVTIFVSLSFGANALKCYVCNSKQNPECHDLEDTYITAQECKGDLGSREEFACLKNSTWRDNLIETDRMCVVIYGANDLCRGRRLGNLFGECFLCRHDWCNGEVLNQSIMITMNQKLILIFTTIVIFLQTVSTY